MKVCKVCKKELPENATFCDGCGNKIIETSIKKTKQKTLNESYSIYSNCSYSMHSGYYRSINIKR
ncbi:hypothetical protein ANS015_03670 [Paraclostridium bifermentans]|nr:hypothetical protein ANS014_07230 [Paraclostridium bifermentans]GKZ05484.1 hypothetical protein ANS015_03670 [Paraclostridium bifermentans]